MVFIQVTFHDINLESKKVSLRSQEACHMSKLSALNMKNIPKLSLWY